MEIYQIRKASGAKIVQKVVLTLLVVEIRDGGRGDMGE